MTDADLLRVAANLIRHRAQHKAVPEGRWYKATDDFDVYVLAPSHDMPGFPWDVAPRCASEPVAEYIASWHPAVALAVADWLEASIPFSARARISPHAVAVARAYLHTDEAA